MRNPGATDPSVEPLFQAQIVSRDGKPATGFNDQLVPAQCSLADLALDNKSGGRADLVVVPPWPGEPGAILSAEKSTIRWLKECYLGGTNLAAVCTGSFLVAEAGLLDERQATTHWFWANEFRRRYTSVDFKPEKMVIDQGRIVTAAGMTAYLNLSLHLIRRFASEELAQNCAKLLLVDSGLNMQTPYAMLRFDTDHGDERISVCQDWIAEHLAEGASLEKLAHVAGLEKRTFLRRFRKATGDTPLEYVQRQRIDRARRLLEVTADPITAVTFQVGYEDVSSFHRLFKQYTGISPGAYRKKFRMRGEIADTPGN